MIKGLKMSLWCLQISPKNNVLFLRISALASKKRSNQKNNLPSLVEIGLTDLQEACASHCNRKSVENDLKSIDAGMAEGLKKWGGK